MSRRVLKEDEWACTDPKCATPNPDYRNMCSKCGKAKPRIKAPVGQLIGKSAAEKSKGLFAAEDWACSKCGNINWARRSTCNICNAPKFGELEARTGYGGGYMDRQEVEYNERQDSDDEYDEFGRKKKKVRKGEGEEGTSGRLSSNDDADAQAAPLSVEATQSSDDPHSSGADEPPEPEPERPTSVPEKEPEPLAENDEKEDNEDDAEEDEDDEEGSDFDESKYDLTAFDSLPVIKKSAIYSTTEEQSNDSSALAANKMSSFRPRSGSVSSDCSCSCSGGSCSCSPMSSKEGRLSPTRRPPPALTNSSSRSKRHDRSRSRSPRRRR